jgi:hypothetical protein
MIRTPWTPEQLDTLRRLYAMTPTIQIAEQIGRPLRATYQKAKDLGLRKAPEYYQANRAGRTGDGRGAHTRFQPGQTPWNKGTSYRPGGRCAQTQFKPGTMSGKAAALYQPVGTYRINADGYLDRKVTDEALPHKRWVAVHRLVWIEAHGPIPRGHVVVFKPGRKSTVLEDITADALECITRQELAARNTIHRYPPALQQAIRLAAKFRRKLDEHADH